LAATIYSGVMSYRADDGQSAADSLAAGLQATGWVMAVISVLGVAMAVVMGRHRQASGTVGDAAAAAAAHTHTLPTTATPVAAAEDR
jgi:hypothetical protein